MLVFQADTEGGVSLCTVDVCREAYSTWLTQACWSMGFESQENTCTNIPLHCTTEQSRPLSVSSKLIGVPVGVILMSSV